MVTPNKYVGLKISKVIGEEFAIYLAHICKNAHGILSPLRLQHAEIIKGGNALQDHVPSTHRLYF